MCSPMRLVNRVRGFSLDTVLGSAILPSLSVHNDRYSYSYYYYYAQASGRSFAPGRCCQG